ncbi:MAG: FKBP-type peptidyl-prolyl cis-trans isomerase [Bacteroidota bacterium]
MKNQHQTLFAYCLLSIICTLFFSCAESEFSDYEQTKTGLYYKFHIHGKDTIHPQYGNVIRIKMIQCLNDSILQNTNDFSPDGLDQYLSEPRFKGAIEEGIRLMCINDSATFLVNSDSVNKYYPTPDSLKMFKPKSHLVFNIKLMQIKTMQEVQWEQEQQFKVYVNERKEKEQPEIEQYLKDNHIDVKPTAKGIYFIEKEKGKGKNPKDGDTVVVHYNGTLLDGTIFDSSVKRNEPFTFVVNDKGQMSVIPGWNEGIKMLKKGSSATFIIPSKLAYDSIGIINPQTKKYFILPYTPLVFDIQLLNIK